jgi:hypothetical protein
MLPGNRDASVTMYAIHAIRIKNVTSIIGSCFKAGRCFNTRADAKANNIPTSTLTISPAIKYPNEINMTSTVSSVICTLYIVLNKERAIASDMTPPPASRELNSSWLVCSNISTTGIVSPQLIAAAKRRISAISKDRKCPPPSVLISCCFERE